MKFLDLDTGYSFDGLWYNYTDWTDWTIEQRVIPDNCDVCKTDLLLIDKKKYDNIKNTDIFEIRYSSVLNRMAAGNPSSNPNNWYETFATEQTCWIATRVKNTQTKGYTFWFPKEQSVGITYTMPICILTETDKPIELYVEENNVFSFVKHVEVETTVDGYTFHDPIYTHSLTTEPENIGKYYAHVFNIACCAQEVGEYICKVNVGEVGFIRVGADLYGEYEPVYINLSNFGVELPDTIQKAIYDSNVHEDCKDHILINRKYKELLSNYWDVVANKGSYKSLKNSLEWFEWDDSLNIKEIWKHNEAGRNIFDDREIMSIFENKILDRFTNFIKTSYVSIFCSLQNELDTYDSEYNPELEAAILKWSKNDIQLKIALLAKFFGIYFMPIHMSILHATAEDKVFTNTIKTIHGSEIKRDDCFGDFEYVECNIKDNAIYKMTNVRAQVTNDTVLGVKYPDTRVFGVDKFPKDAVIDEESIRTFAVQYYSGPGVIVPIRLTIPNQNLSDYIKETHITYNDENGIEQTIVSNDIFKVKKNVVNINFNFLAKTPQNYTIRFTFIFASSKTITRSVEFTVEDTDNITINLYKVHAKDDSEGFTKADFNDYSNSKYFYKIQNNGKESYYTQYLPYLLPSHELYNTYNGIKLNRVIIVDFREDNIICNKEFHDEYEHDSHNVFYLRAIMYDDYLEYAKYDESDPENVKLTYLIYISKKFFSAPPKELYNNKYGYNYRVIRDDLGFFPQFHYLELIKTNDKFEDFTVNPYEAFCCAVEINTEDGVKDFRYGHMIDSAEWTLYNQSNDFTIERYASTQSPFMANTTKNALPSGYYDISFKYSLVNGKTNKYTLNSAFRINKM
jgi:hypothetical protein